MTCAVIYARFSSQLQRDASIEDQIRLCRERIAREGWSEGPGFADRGVSGTSMIRPGLQDLLEAASTGAFDIVVAEALDRLSRDQADVATIFKRLAFAGVRIVTLAEGEISELHVGLKGTMNQLFLKDLADKTRRGLRGRVEAGMSGGGNSYGYDVVRRLGPDGQLVTGERVINGGEAEVIRRIFREFATGVSPKAIAKRLNADKVPGPRGALWRDTAIRGHRQRGTGLLNNELYIGRLIWNRLRYVKDPQTGRRVSRQKPPEAWITTEVPDLRIVDDALWADLDPGVARHAQAPSRASKLSSDGWTTATSLGSAVCLGLRQDASGPGSGTRPASNSAASRCASSASQARSWAMNSRSTMRRQASRRGRSRCSTRQAAAYSVRGNRLSR
jgi:DNA invertase Pin-like site-specific DNA recombinase